VGGIVYTIPVPNNTNSKKRKQDQEEEKSEIKACRRVFQHEYILFFQRLIFESSSIPIRILVHNSL
jgi:hypothetical protein